MRTFKFDKNVIDPMMDTLFVRYGKLRKFFAGLLGGIFVAVRIETAGAISVQAASCPFNVAAVQAQRSGTLQIAAPDAALWVDVALSPAQRERGLMYRTVLPRHNGMLFLFEHDAPRRFWMKNTLIPLDMVFLNPNGTVTGIQTDALPDDTHGASPRIYDGRGCAVLELPAHEAAVDGLHRGAAVRVVAP